jgi:asparagine synthase (glutamine-hydrolysing)
MCGIFGLYSRSTVDQAAVTAALDRLSHRGPDARAVWTSADRRLALGHARLKILDLSDAANQPMESPDGRWVLIYNGEIFNFADIRRGYRGPWQFRTQGDTEVLLATFAAKGLEAMRDWVGMFAFALLDRELNKLHLVRDRFGIKPLYWIRRGDGGFAFASEIPALLPLLSSVDADEDVIRTYLETGIYDGGARTFFRQVHALEPGCAAVIDLDRDEWEFTRWYRLADHVPDMAGADHGALVEEGRALLHKALRDHMVSDVRVGLNVSGGLDSSILVALAGQYAENIHVFSQDFAAPYSEAEWVRQVASDCHLHLQSLSHDDIFERLDETVRIQAEPFGGVTVCGYDAIYRAASREGVTVLLDGNGADEVFLGYGRYRAAQEEGSSGALPAATGRAIDGTIAVRPDVVSDHLRQSANLITVKESGGGFSDPVKSAAAVDLLATKIPRGLRFNDRMSMAQSKELRVPFLDHRLVEFGFGVPAQYLLNGRGNKVLLREIAEGWIPHDVAWAPKRAVQSPQREWLAEEWAGYVQGILSSESLAARGWIDPQRAARAFQAYRADRPSNSFFVWQWLNLELWARRFLD